MISALSSPEREVRVRALAGDIALCSLARDSTLTVPLSPQEYKWVPANYCENITNCGEVTSDGPASHPGEVGGGGSRNTPSRLMLQIPGYEPVRPFTVPYFSVSS